MSDRKALSGPMQEQFGWNPHSPSPRPSPPGKVRTSSSAGECSPFSDFSPCDNWSFPLLRERILRNHSRFEPLNRRHRRKICGKKSEDHFLPTIFRLRADRFMERIPRKHLSRVEPLRACAKTPVGRSRRRKEVDFCGRNSRTFRLLTSAATISAHALNRQSQVGLGVHTPPRPSRVSSLLGGGVRTPSPTFRFVGRLMLLESNARSFDTNQSETPATNERITSPASEGGSVLSTTR